MVTLRPGSHVWRLLTVLSAAGEFPAQSLHLLGSERTLEKLVHRLELPQEVRSPAGAVLGTYKLLTVSGRRERRTIRLCKGALPLLQALHPAALSHYLAMYGAYRFSSNDAHVQRNHRVAEALALCFGAGAEVRPCALPPLQKREICQVVPDSPSFYIARSLKRLDSTEMNKTIFTRLTGALFCPDICYAIYNARGAVMKWSGMGEFKTANHLTELARMNAGIPQTDRAILLGECMDIALQTLLESDKSRRMELRFDRIYQHIHYIPMNELGMRMLRILMLPDWNEQMLSAAFPPEWRLLAPSSLECDAQREESLILSHLDGDIARLVRLRQALENTQIPFEILCFPWQSAFLHDYLGSRVQLREIDLEALEGALGLAVPEADEYPDNREDELS